MKKQNLKVLAICGGNGVICHPFKDHLIANVEERALFKTPNDVQWKMNFPNTPLYTKMDKFVEDFSTKPDVDLIIGAPDCGHSSILSYSRTKRLHNPRDNKSLTQFLQSVKMIQPKVFLMENLPAMLKEISKAEIKEYYEEYRLKFIEGSVSMFGNSQKTRKRLVIVGVLRGSGWNLKDLVKGLVKEGDDHLKTSGELLEGLVYGESAHVREDIDDRITLYAGFKMSLRDIQTEWLKRGVSRWEVLDRRFMNAPAVYLNLKDAYPMTARKANRQFNHEGLQMSPRELARIQGVPDTFKIWFHEGKQGYCINKGRTTVTKTPPYEIGLWLSRNMGI